MRKYVKCWNVLAAGELECGGTRDSVTPSRLIGYTMHHLSDHYERYLLEICVESLLNLSVDRVHLIDAIAQRIT